MLQVLTTCFPADMPSAEGILTQPQTLTAHPVPKESGRAGRDGLPSSSIMFFNTQDASLVRWIIDKESGRKGRKRKLGAEGESSGGSQSAALQVWKGCFASRLPPLTISDPSPCWILSPV